MSELVIDAKGLTRVYRVGDGDMVALDHVDLRVARGEFVAIMGASGSGKSTSMAILGCLDRPTNGHYLLRRRRCRLSGGAGARPHPQRKAGLRLPELQPAGPHQRARECRPAAVLFASRHRPCGGSAAAAHAPPWRVSALPAGKTIRRRNCRAASSSASRSPGR